MSTAEIEGVEAFTSIGVAPDKAMAAAAALNKRDALADVQGVNIKLAVLTWMVGFNLALTVAIVIRLFLH
jgi:hypothetical protein